MIGTVKNIKAYSIKTTTSIKGILSLTKDTAGLGNESEIGMSRNTLSVKSVRNTED